MTHSPTPPLEQRQTYMFTAVIDGVLPGKRLEYWAHSVEEAQAMAEAEYAGYGDRAEVKFVGINIMPDPGRPWYNVPQGWAAESPPTQVYCDGYDAYQEEPTHPRVYYTPRQGSDGVYRAACHYCGRKWVSTE